MMESTPRQLLEIVRRFSPDADYGTNLLESGSLDSLNIVKLLTAIECELGVSIALEDLELSSLCTVSSIADVVLAAGRSSALLDDLRAIFRDEFAVVVASVSQRLFETGALDSMTLIQLILRLETHFGINLSLADLELSQFETLEGIAETIASSLKSLPQTAS